MLSDPNGMNGNRNGIVLCSGITSCKACFASWAARAARARSSWRKIASIQWVSRLFCSRGPSEHLKSLTEALDRVELMHLWSLFT
ncbi:hypothetical protein BpHYR1_023473 [Brachionus plicatilis]|uniref:Uncharacterized protein n=1 Tax=Brachionus plicatilis TaxID=10195 RepID=A0A3M7QAC1_BRAPC|nr:hypothetical protein BpHYR1_023473 [Brachionus plicatilis]